MTVGGNSERQLLELFRGRLAFDEQLAEHLVDELVSDLQDSPIALALEKSLRDNISWIDYAIFFEVNFEVHRRAAEQTLGELVREKRRDRRLKLEESAVIFVDVAGPTVDCMINDGHQRGFGLAFSVPPDLPPVFWLWVPSYATSYRCALRWCSGARAGVELLGSRRPPKGVGFTELRRAAIGSYEELAS